MKRAFLFLVVVAFVSISQSSSAQHTISDLAGRWESSDGTVGSLEFLDGGKVQASMNGLQIPPTPYTIDFGRSPIWFDVAVAPSKSVKGLIEFIDEDTIKYQIFLSGNVSYDFTTSDADPVIVLKRKK